jgi:hypothetical protein
MNPLLRADASGRKFHDPTYRSCTKFIAEMVDRYFGFDSSRPKDLIHWADITDGAQFESAAGRFELREPATRLMMVIEGVRMRRECTNSSRRFPAEEPEEIVNLEWVQEAFASLPAPSRMDRNHSAKRPEQRWNHLFRCQQL